MTAINLAVQPARRAAYLISDCAFTTPDGRLDRIAGKIISFERFPCAIGMTGNLDLAALGRALLALDARNLRTLLLGLPQALSRALGDTLAMHTGMSEGWGMLKVAAWDARRKRPAGYLIATDAQAAEAVLGPEWGAYQVAECSSAHGTHEHISDLLGRPCQLEDAATFDPHVHGYALIAAQRQRGSLNITPGISDYPFRIGGEAELTEVTRRGVRVWGVGTFPDKIGERINPQLAPA